jgi:ATP adenylyltransferase
MKRMWSPWRSRYIQTFTRPVKKGRRSPASLFTAARKSRNDDKHLIVWRGSQCFVIMNLYPYNSGHVLIVPYREVPDLEGLTRGELAEIMSTAQRAMRALRKVMKPQGFNFGANIGRAGGAGVEKHVHFHVVPRWNGDTNFMPVLADAKVISEDMKATLKKLRRVF